jgi:hypothetical protein
MPMCKVSVAVTLHIHAQCLPLSKHQCLWPRCVTIAPRYSETQFCVFHNHRHVYLLQVHFREAGALVEGPLSNLKQSLVQLSRPIRVRDATPCRPAACGA